MTVAETPKAPSAPATLGLAVGLTLVWLVYAFVRADTTVHLGPLLVPLVPVVTANGASRVVPLTVAAIGLAAGAIGVLAVSGNLGGPSLGPFANAAGESVAVLVAAGTTALVSAALSRRNRGEHGAIEDRDTAIARVDGSHRS